MSALELVASIAIFPACVNVAGAYGGATVNRRIVFVQAVPALIALALVLAANN